MRNLTEISLKNQSLVWYFILMTAIGGIFCYLKLGRMEDPAFTIRQMIITAAWPGASAEQMTLQVTDKIEKKLQDTPGLDNIRSETRAGFTIIYVSLRDEIEEKNIRPTWRDVRNFCEDIKGNFPRGVVGPFYNDRFDDVFGSIYALTGDGFSYEEMREEAEKIRQIILQIESVQKVELLGVQEEKIFVEIEQAKLSELGISPQIISESLAAQNQMTASGMIETFSDDIYLRVTGIFDDVEAIKNLSINANGKIFRLGDVAKISKKFSEPAEPKMFFDGEKSIGIAVSMESGGNILKLGKNLKEMTEKIQKNLPVGMELHQVSNQPQVVENSIQEFVKTLCEAIIIVLCVSFLSLGFRSGLVVAFCIPLVLCGVFLIMYLIGIDLHKVSLGALIISLGLLVDDAIIAVEMMSVKLEEGLEKFDAACFAFEATAKPMLTGTLITCAGFIPVAFAHGLASEFCATLFPVISTALLLSWIASVMIAPLFGFYLIRVEKKNKIPYQNKFYKIFRRILEKFLENRVTVLVSTLIIFFASIFLLKFVKQEFFPPSLRPEIIVEMTLPEGSSKIATQTEAENFSKFLSEHAEKISNFSCYVGKGAPRFVLTAEPILNRNNFAQFIIVANDIDAREFLTKKIREEFEKNFPNVRSHIKFIPMGPPADYPVMIRVSGTEIEKVKNFAKEIEKIAAEDENIFDINSDWMEKSKILRVELDQDKLKSLGISSQTVSQMLYTEISGATAAEFYKNDRTIDIDLKIKNSETKNLSQIKNLPIFLKNSQTIPLEQIAKISLAAEDGLIKRRNLMPTITICAEIKNGTANDATQKIFDATENLRKKLPPGYKIEVGGALENSNKATKFLIVPVPAMIFIIMTLLMIQLRSGKQMILTILTAPLGIIGVSFAMILTDKPIGFVANLGILALSGMIIRNSVILIDQIQKHLESGEKIFDAIIDSAILRFRPIMLTAAAAILGMIPLMSSNLWGPMAVAIAGGLLVATILTLLVLPTMYAFFYKVEK